MYDNPPMQTRNNSKKNHLNHDQSKGRSISKESLENDNTINKCGDHIPNITRVKGQNNFMSLEPELQSLT